MRSTLNKYLNNTSLSLILLLPLSAMAFTLPPGFTSLEFGLFNSVQGEAQDIDIQGLVGNQYTVNNNHAANGFAGLGYFFEAINDNDWQLAYGISGYYFGPTTVKGSILQEHAFSNLDYSYNIQNTPVYLAAKAKFKQTDRYDLTVDGGIGVNFMRISDYNETPTDSYTLPDNAFSSQNNTNFSAMTGVGIRFNNVLGKNALECGYRFFYLGNGQLTSNNSQVLTPLKTGNVYANALVVTLSF